jgi:hypothetical protein
VRRERHKRLRPEAKGLRLRTQCSRVRVRACGRDLLLLLKGVIGSLPCPTCLASRVQAEASQVEVMQGIAVWLNVSAASRNKQRLFGCKISEHQYTWVRHGATTTSAPCIERGRLEGNEPQPRSCSAWPGRESCIC